MAVVGDRGAQIVQQCAGVEQFSFGGAIAVQGGELLKQAASEVTHVIGVLFLVAVVAGNVEDTEAPDVRDHRVGQVLPEVFAENALSEAPGRNGQRIDSQRVHGHPYHHTALQDNVGAVSAQARDMLALVDGQSAKLVDALVHRSAGQGETV